MNLKDYLEKRAFDLAFPVPPKPNTAKMLNYFNAAVKNKGYDVKPHLVQHIDAYPSVGYSDLLKRDTIITPVSAFGPLTHEVGHMYSGHTKIPHGGVLRQIPIVGDVVTLATEARANTKSWKMLKDAYGDDKKLLDTVKKIDGIRYPMLILVTSLIMVYHWLQLQLVHT